MSGPRRENRERGIYYRLDRDGRRVPGIHEVTYRDHHGVKRWATVHGGITAARSDRAKLIANGGPAASPKRDTFGEVADAYLDSKRHLAQNTRDGYKRAVENHLRPAWGTRPIASIDADDITHLFADLREPTPKRPNGYADWTLRAVWTPMVGIFKHAARRGLIAESPVTRLDREERPTAGAASKRFLERDEIERLLAAAEADKPLWHALIATATFTGLRIGELLALTWADVDTKAGFLHVREQLDAKRQRKRLKTKSAERDVVLMTALAGVLRRYRMLAPLSHDDRLVFANTKGKAPDRTTVRKALKRARIAAGVAPLRFHDLRHTFASILIVDQGKDVVFVSKQLGHRKPSTTLDTYAHLFDRARHADDTRAGLDDSYGDLLGGAEA